MKSELKFSELLTEFLELRDEGDVTSDWRSMRDVAEENMRRRDRQRELLYQMDSLIGASHD